MSGLFATIQGARRARNKKAAAVERTRIADAARTLVAVAGLNDALASLDQTKILIVAEHRQEATELGWIV